MAVKLNSIERDVLDKVVSLNENLMITTRVRDNSFIYRSRFLDINLKEQILIIDEASVDTPDAKPISKGERFEVFFELKGFRYLFNTELLEHVQFQISGRSIYALKIRLPEKLSDGERREYFRVSVPNTPPIIARFNIFKKEDNKPVMSAMIQHKAEVFEGIVVDIAGGGFALKAKPNSSILEKELAIGDTINAKFELSKTIGEMEIYSMVRSKYKYKDTEILIWGFKFLSGEKNKQLKLYRNKIMRYVAERQRALMAL